MARLATYGKNIGFSSSGSSGWSAHPLDEDGRMLMELSHVLTSKELMQLAEQLGQVSSKKEFSVRLRKAHNQRFPRSAQSTTSQALQEPFSHSANVLGKAVEGEYRYALLGLILGLAAIIGGVILGLNGVAGSTSWTAKLIGLESNLNDAAPAVVLFVVGIFLVLITRPKVKLENLRD